MSKKTGKIVGLVRLSSSPVQSSSLVKIVHNSGVVHFLYYDKNNEILVKVVSCKKPQHMRTTFMCSADVLYRQSRIFSSPLAAKQNFLTQ